MKYIKRIQAFLLCTVFIIAALAFSACGNNETDPTSTSENTGTSKGNITYKVTVVDGFGVPYTEKIIVKFMQNGTQSAMAIVDENGSVEKSLAAGEYAIEIDTTENGVSCYYDIEKAIVTPETAQLQLTMAYTASGEQIAFTATSQSTETSKDYLAYPVGVGSTHVALDPEDRTYVVFVPSEGGTYQFSVMDQAADIGYYGAPHFVQENSLEEVSDNRFTISVPDGGISSDTSGTTRLVIGLDSKDAAKDAILNIQRIGDVEWSIMDEPWSTYQPKTEIVPYVAPEGIAFKSFDLTAPSVAYKLVLNGADGYYHLNNADGPVVYVQLANEAYGISMKNMVGEIVYVDGVLMQSGVTSFRYMYDNGSEDFFKEDYTDLMRQYVTNRDPKTGVYPMTADLYYALTMGTKFIGWCDPENANYRFETVPGINNEISWLFLCVYEDTGDELPTEPVPGEDIQDPTTPTTPSADGSNSGTAENTPPANTTPIEDNKSNPIEIGGTLSFNAKVQANHIVHFNLYRVTDTTLTIRSNNAYVIYNRKTYYAKNGVVTVPNLYSSNTNVPVKIAIGNQGSSDADYLVQLSYPGGHKMNPYKLEQGSVTTHSAAGNNQGVYYTFTAPSSGVLSVTLDRVSGGAQGNICITSEQVSGGTVAVDLRESSNGDGNTVSFTMKAGEQVEVQIGVLPDDGFNYPEATINCTVSFQ